MYRHSAHINVARSSLPSPARDESSDSESEILAELDQKRREIDDEIASFKAQKEKEFRTFQRDLRSRRKPLGSQPKITEAAKGTSAISAVSNLFVGNQGRPNGLNKGKNPTDALSNSRSRPIALPSHPTVSVEKLTINGTTTPPILGTPPLTRSLSRSPSNLSATPPRKSAGKSSRRDEEKTDFHGLFTPTYLPLLDARSGSSLPQDRVNSLPGKRALTIPAIPSTSLPSALRTASGSGLRKRKHVTFQLGDTTIVEPSSSYEELPSPEKSVSSERIDEMMNVAAKNTAPAPTSPDFGGKFAAASDGGSGVGFFELDEELDDLDDREVDYHEDPDEDQKKERSDDDPQEESKSGSFHAGSLPIDIIRPGSFRDSSAIQ